MEPERETPESRLQIFVQERGGGTRLRGFPVGTAGWEANDEGPAPTITLRMWIREPEVFAAAAIRVYGGKFVLNGGGPGREFLTLDEAVRVAEGLVIDDLESRVWRRVRADWAAESLPELNRAAREAMRAVTG